MEALSIQAVKANLRPAEADAQAQSGLGDIFQALLRDNVEQRDAPLLLPRADDRPERDAPQRDFVDENVDVAGGGQRDRSDDRDIDYRAYEAPPAVESRPDETVKEREVAANTEAQPRPNQSTASDQPPATQDVAAASDGDTPGPAQGSKEQNAVASDTRVSPLAPTQPAATGQGVVAPIVDSGVQANIASVLPASSSKAAAPQAITPAANQAQNPALPQPSAPSTTTATTPTSAGNNGFAAQVTITPAQVVATPNAGLGGGAAAVAIATANTAGQTGPAKPNTGPGTGESKNATATFTTSAEIQSSPGVGRLAGTLPSAQTAPTDGQALAAQSANNAAAATATQKQEPGTSGSETRTGTALNNLTAKGTPVQAAVAEATPAQPTQNGTTRDVTGKNAAGQSDGTKATNGQNQQAQSAPQAPAGQAANVAAQTGGAIAPAQSLRNGGPGGSAGSTDTASSRIAGASTVDTGGFTQALARGSDSLASLTRSGGSNPTVANQVAVEIQKAFNTGKDQIRIRLNPAELGQIDVSLKVRNDGTIKAIVTIDRPETFDLMQRDARGLERALQDAGLKTDSGSLSFNLRGGDQQAPNGGQRGQGLTAQSNPESDRTTDTSQQEADTPAPYISDHALDIHV